MADVVNLRLARKAKRRAAAEAGAAANRAAFGALKAERTETLAETRRRDRALDAAKRES